MPVKTIDADLGTLRINEASFGVVLEKLRSEYGIYSFFEINTKVNEAPVLRIGLPFYEPKKTKTFLIERVFVENDLNWITEDEIKLKVKGVLINGNTKIEKDFGDAEGDLRTVFQYEGNEEDLKRTCQQFLSESKYTGYFGSFTTFLEPTMLPGDYAVINSYKYPDRSGTYVIKSVKTTVGVGGGRQEIELERRVS
jgi:hypothetical protein